MAYPRVTKHHLLFSRIQHEAIPDNKYVRNSMGLIVPLLETVHAQLHRECPPVPAFDIVAARAVRKELRNTNNPLDAVKHYTEAVESMIEYGQVHDTQKRLGELVLVTVALQSKFIEEGYCEPPIQHTPRHRNR